MKTKYLSIFLGMVLSLLICCKSYAQRCISFDYDINGNRIGCSVYDNCSKDEIVEEIYDIQENELECELLLYPNPSDTEVNLVIPFYSDNIIVCYTIFDESGIIRQSGNVKSKDTSIDISKFVSGAYILVVDSGGLRYTKTIVKL